MFYVILAVLSVIVFTIFCLAVSEKKTVVTITAKFIDAAFAGIGAGLTTVYLAKYLTTLIS